MPQSNSIFCKRCDYHLIGVPAGPCPECSTPFDPVRPRTFRTRSRRYPAARLRRWTVFLLALAALVTFFPRGYNRTVATRVCPTCSASTSWTAVTVNAPRWFTPYYFSLSWRSGPQPCAHAGTRVQLASAHESIRFLPYRRAANTGTSVMGLAKWPDASTAADDLDAFVRSAAVNSVQMGSARNGIVAASGTLPKKIVDELQSEANRSGSGTPLMRQPAPETAPSNSPAPSP